MQQILPTGACFANQIRHGVCLRNMAALDEWLREVFLPQLPGKYSNSLSGRHA